MFDPEHLVRPSILRVTPYQPGTPLEQVQRQLGLDDIIKMASNECALGSSPLAVQAMTEELTGCHRYPESTAPALCEKLAARLHVQPEQIVLDNGEDAVISLIAMTFVNPGDEVVMPAISFPSFESSAVKMDGVAVKVPLRADMRVDMDAMCAALTLRTKLVFLCNPSNPTGLISTRAEFEQLLAAMPDGALLASDEAYCDFVGDPSYPQTLSYLAAHSNLLVLRSFSKIYGLAGLRVGYAIGHPGVIGMMYRARNVFPVNRIAQAGALAALDDHEFRKLVIEMNRQGRKQLQYAFGEMGLEYWPSQANFILVRTGRPSAAVYDAMLRRGVIVRPQGGAIGDTVRISVGTAEENERCIRALEQALAE